ncbi:CocE/NonD family hydrolase [Mycolicibacterium stellerae]|uniref:CocE/NonD family hydrolase n=1 Tax=Mycolicibacterium stellerae TaxID=2358193 RepID=UPI001F412B88|nr:CocE/NonD family hydrolase [Mycolicibacterium stellerae]
MPAVNNLVGRTLGRLLGLPPHTTEYEVVHRVRVPMRDGVELVADHYRPLTANPAGTLLVRTPYGRGYPASALFGSVYAARGYHVVIQSVRGTFGSGGDFIPFDHEIADGADTAAWLRDQPWFTGSFATMGASYLGFTQWALLTDPPPEMAAAVITVGPHDLSGPRWGTGSFGLNDFLGWNDAITHQEDPGRIRNVVRMVRTKRMLADATAGLPLGEAGRALLGEGAPWYESWLEHPEHDDPFWAQTRLHSALERTEIPVLLLTGWQDVFIDQTLEQYTQLRRRDVPVAVTIGSWSHGHLLTKGAPTVLRESLGWLDSHLAGNGGAKRSPVRIHVNHGGWLDLEEWPPAMPEQVRYLQPGGRLGDAVPPDTAPASTFTYDPADPTPTVGGRLLSPVGGYRRDDKLAERSDVATFTGDALPQDVHVVGNPVLELSHSCDNPHNDLFVRVSEVDSKGRSRNVSDGYRRATGDSGTITIELDAVAHRFRAGSRIRVLVAGGSHPRFARNLGTGEPLLTGRALRPATHSVHVGDGASRLRLPAGAPPSPH